MTTERPMLPPRAESIHAFPVRLSELDPRDVIADLLEELLLDDPRAVADMVIERLRDAGFEIRPTEKKSVDSFSQLAEAEDFLKSQGFWLVADSCDWTNAAGDDAGIYAIDGRYGTVKAWRVEINRRAAPVVVGPGDRT